MGNSGTSSHKQLIKIPEGERENDGGTVIEKIMMENFSKPINEMEEDLRSPERPKWDKYKGNPNLDAS